MDNPAKVKEWIKQADYDFETAKAMLAAGRYIYCVFMCHLAIEKALKGLHQNSRRDIPPKSHNLVYLSRIQNLELPEDVKGFLESLDRVSVPTRYPSELDKLLSEYNEQRADQILQKTQEVITCLKTKLERP